MPIVSLFPLHKPMLTTPNHLLVLSLSWNYFFQEDFLHHLPRDWGETHGLIVLWIFLQFHSVIKMPFTVTVVTARVELGYKLRGQRTLQHLSFLHEDQLVSYAPSVTSLKGKGLYSALALYLQSSWMLFLADTFQPELKENASLQDRAYGQNSFTDLLIQNEVLCSR